MLRIGEVPEFSAQRGLKALLLSTLWVAVLAVLPGTPVAAQESQTFRVVVNASNPESSATLEQVGEMFRKEVSNWGGGPQVVPVDLPTASPIRESFSMAVHGRPGSAIDAFWRRQVFSGRGSPPVVLDSDQSVVDYLASNPYAIGYVSADTPLPPSVKVLDIQSRATTAYAASAVDELPVGTSRPRLAYPDDLLARRVEGSVLLEFMIDENGRVEGSSVRVIESSNPGFEDAAEDMIKQSRFRPGRIGGNPVAVVVQQMVRFTL